MRPTWHRRGVVLIMVAAVLAVLAALATGFYTMMLSQSRSSVRYMDSVRAEMLARGGIGYGVSALRAQCYSKTEDPSDPWYPTSYLNGAAKRISFAAKDSLGKDLPYTSAVSNSANNPGPLLDSDRVTLNISDAASKINLNGIENLSVVLDNLCRVIGPPLVAADQRRLTQRVWEWYGGTAFTQINADPNDWPSAGTKGSYPGATIPRDIYYWLYDSATPTNNLIWTNGAWIGGVTQQQMMQAHPERDPSGVAVFGDGYAIAGYRAIHGKFTHLEDVKAALTFVPRSTANPDADRALESFEREVKFSVIKDYLTIDSWRDLNSVCVGKFEWVYDVSGAKPSSIAIDRDKSWIPDDQVNDPLNTRGSLRGAYVSIINGHGAGQLRRIVTNGIDWIQVDQGFKIPPGPASSYMIMAQEDALIMNMAGAAVPRPMPCGFPLGTTCFPQTNPDGTLIDDPDIDYVARPLCIHRSPVNINTASDKVLEAMFLGINLTQGNYMAVGTDADMSLLAKYTNNKIKARDDWKPGDTDWKIGDYLGEMHKPPTVLPYRTAEPYIITPRGMKRIPASPGMIALDAAMPDASPNFAYLNNSGNLNSGAVVPAIKPPDFVSAAWATWYVPACNEVHQLAYRIIVAREPDNPPTANLYIDPKTGKPSSTVNLAFQRGPFKSWDDFYFRVVKPWDDTRQADSTDPAGVQHKASVARLIMAAFNSNTDILKFNPNIEWIDRFGRNFTEMEPIMAYTNQKEQVLPAGQTPLTGTLGHGAIDSGDSTWDYNGGPNTNDLAQALIKALQPTTCDFDGFMSDDAVPIFVRERNREWPNFSIGTYLADPRYSGAYVTRSYRYKADEMIDKTDLNRSTTEFCFDSGGIYQIDSTGQVVTQGNIQAERRMSALVKVYSVWRETTQRQFTQGTITQAAGPRGSPFSGQVGRDASPANNGAVDYRLALTTLPEPLVPLQYKIVNPRNIEVVDTTISSTTKKRDAWGNEVDIATPLVVANHILPAAYDGQIVLATNTQAFIKSSYATDPVGDMDTFLASFNGDLDTETCNGNGHEQAKEPINCKVQVLDSIGLLGALNDTELDSDPGLARLVPPASAVSEPCAHADDPTMPLTPPLHPPVANEGTNGQPLPTTRIKTALNALRGLNPLNYWDNMTCRQGDLRTEGVYVGGPGVGGNDGVFKYLCGSEGHIPAGYSMPPLPAGMKVLPADYDVQNMNLNGKDALLAAPGEDYNRRGTSGDHQGFLISMWAKTIWHHDDGRNHEFFDSTMPGWADNGVRAEGFWLRKQGRLQWACSESWNESNPLSPYKNGLIDVWSKNSEMTAGRENGTWGLSGAGNRNGDLSWVGEHIQDRGDWSEPDWTCYLYGGQSGVPNERTDPNYSTNGQYYRPESPAYRIQPFRWSFVGARLYLTNATNNPHKLGGAAVYQPGSDQVKQQDGSWAPGTPVVSDPGDPTASPAIPACNRNPPNAHINYIPSGDDASKRGMWHNTRWDDPDPVWIASFIQRAFVDTERWPEGPRFEARGKFWSTNQTQGSTAFNGMQDKGRSGGVMYRANGGQTVRYIWAHPGGTATADGLGINQNVIFGVNNCNPGVDYSKWFGEFDKDKTGVPMNRFTSIYRGMPEEGTFAVIDEYKISRKDVVLRAAANPYIQNPTTTTLEWDDCSNWPAGPTQRMRSTYIGPKEFYQPNPDYVNDRIVRWNNATMQPEGDMYTSRYYLPPDPTNPALCPTFTSQTMLQSMKGFDKTLPATPETIILGRVSWTCFTPRFMSEYKVPDEVVHPRFVRDETISTGLNPISKQQGDWGNFTNPLLLSSTTPEGPSNPIVPGAPILSPNPVSAHVAFKGPFDYCKYNDIAGFNKQLGGTDFSGTSKIAPFKVLVPEQPEDFGDIAYDKVPNVFPYRCDRPTPDQYPASGPWAAGQSQSTRGIEVELLNKGVPIPGSTGVPVPGVATTWTTTSTFNNPDAINRFGDEKTYTAITTDQLQYRVRFRYPVDPLADPYSGPMTKPVTQYLLDTPVFDDIAVTYFQAPQILDFREVSE